MILLPWDRQPVGSVPVNWASPAAKGLEVLVYGGVAVTKTKTVALTVTTGSPVVGTGIAGIGPRFTSGQQRFSAGSGPVLSGSEGFTLEVLCAITAAPSLSGFFASDFGSAGSARGLLAFSGTRNIYFWGGGADLASGVDWRIDGSLQHVFCVSEGGSGTTMRFYRDGAQIASGTTPPLTTTTGNFIVGDAAQGWAAVPDGVLFKCALYRAALSPAEIADRTAHPWRLFEPRRIYVKAAGGGSVTGTVNYTNANDTSAASGSTTIVGTLARTNANDTSAASGSTTIVGSLATTNANDTVAASGNVGSGVSGTVAYTNANDTVVASGSTTIIGVLSYQNANDTMVAAGVVGSITGTVAYTNNNDTCSASGIAGLSEFATVYLTTASATNLDLLIDSPTKVYITTQDVTEIDFTLNG